MGNITNRDMSDVRIGSLIARNNRVPVGNESRKAAWPHDLLDRFSVMRLYPNEQVGEACSISYIYFVICIQVENAQFSIDDRGAANTYSAAGMTQGSRT